MQQHLDFRSAVGKAFLVVADIAHDLARDLGDHFAVDHGTIAIFFEKGRLAATFAGHDDLVGSTQGLAPQPGIHLAVIRDAELEIVLDECIEDRVRNLIADLVGMSFGDGLAGEKIIGV